jgi:hypothetical protein
MDITHGMSGAFHVTCEYRRWSESHLTVAYTLPLQLVCHTEIDIGRNLDGAGIVCRFRTCRSSTERRWDRENGVYDRVFAFDVLFKA